ncbi:MAG: 1 protein [Patescibacteria group bacterium]|nr:1 protein [Patescibacteria group bacterium]
MAIRKTNLYKAESTQPFKLSRSKIDSFLNCERCFYLDRKLGVSQPPGYPFNLNSAVDALLKKEFDIHRAAGTVHPLLKNYGLKLKPLQHPNMNVWRENFVGVQYFHEPSNFLVTGAVDDLWVDDAGLIHVVDYKATSKSTEVNLDAKWQIGYKRQMEVYQWLLRQNGFQVSDTGYFVYCNGRTDRQAFDAKLEFDIKIIPYTGKDIWIEKTLLAAQKCLSSAKLPKVTPDCPYCQYRQDAQKFE